MRKAKYPKLNSDLVKFSRELFNDIRRIQIGHGEGDLSLAPGRMDEEIGHLQVAGETIALVHFHPAVHDLLDGLFADPQHGTETPNGSIVPSTVPGTAGDGGRRLSRARLLFRHRQHGRPKSGCYFPFPGLEWQRTWRHSPETKFDNKTNQSVNQSINRSSEQYAKMNRWTDHERKRTNPTNQPQSTNQWKKQQINDSTQK